MSEQPLQVSIIYDCTLAERRQARRILSRKRYRKPGRGGPVLRLVRTALRWALFIGLMAIWFVLVILPPLQNKGLERILRDLPWPVALSIGAFSVGIIFLLIDIALLRSLGRDRERRWRGKMVLSFDQDGLTQQRPGRTDIFKWARFPVFREGPDVFALRNVARQTFTIPKRLFADDAECESIRFLLEENVGNRVKPGEGHFPVIYR